MCVDIYMYIVILHTCIYIYDIYTCVNIRHMLDHRQVKMVLVPVLKHHLKHA